VRFPGSIPVKCTVGAGKFQPYFSVTDLSGVCLFVVIDSLFLSFQKKIIFSLRVARLSPLRSMVGQGGSFRNFVIELPRGHPFGSGSVYHFVERSMNLLLYPENMISWFEYEFFVPVFSKKIRVPVRVPRRQASPLYGGSGVFWIFINVNRCDIFPADS
jgi:hypothetical protein